ncbi:MAG: radical SAM protein [Deltaproteobacteria bacterium]|nr:radical SAM protein [Deltaproteobacteria bacterium]
MSLVSPLEQSFVTGVARLWAFAYLIVALFLRYTGQLVLFRMGPRRYVVTLLRLLRFLKVLRHNKVVKINGGYKFQLYFPVFPSPAFDHALKKFDPATTDPGPLSVVIGMTKACSYACPHCYQRHDVGGELELETLVGALREMQQVGVALFNLEGGEPMLKLERLLHLVRALGEKAEVWVNTTGDGVTLEKAKAMREAGVYGVFVSLHSPDRQECEAFFGKPGSFEVALQAMSTFRQVGIAVAINYCASVQHAQTDGCERLFDLARDQGCAFVQLIHNKPAGSWIGEKEALIREEALVEKLRRLHVDYNLLPRYAQHPSISAHVFEEGPEVFGCTAGGIERFYLGHSGEVQPCEFLNISFGNVKEERFTAIYRRMREHFRTANEDWPCCAEAASLEAAFAQMSLVKTPLPREQTLELVKTWKPAVEPKLYRDLNLYPQSREKSR